MFYFCFAPNLCLSSFLAKLPPSRQLIISKVEDIISTWNHPKQKEDSEFSFVTIRALFQLVCCELLPMQVMLLIMQQFYVLFLFSSQSMFISV